MNDNIDKNINLENLEDKELEQVNGSTMAICYGDCHGNDVSFCQFIEYETCLYGYEKNNLQR